MNLQCRKCGERIEVPEEALSADTPRVTCPGCSTRYRLKPKKRSTDAGGGTSGGPASGDKTAVDPENAAPARANAASGPIFQPGTVVAERYRVVRFIAQGGMGEVYEAEDVELRQEVALKTVSAKMGEESGILDRFKREIALARTVTHPNVCRIFDLGSHRAGGDSLTFLTMELLRGETLAELLRRRHRLSTAEALPLIEQMCAGLDAAHRARVVHRDFKSENVFLEGQTDRLPERRVVITDFGVARGTDAADRFAAQVTGLGIVGTPAYMAPEQVENKVITQQADLYALGIVIYEMVTGCLPFDAESPLTTAVKRLREPPPPPHVHVPDLPAWWERAILRCLEKRPDDRFPDALSVIEALHKPVRRTVVGATVPLRPEPAEADGPAEAATRISRPPMHEGTRPNPANAGTPPALGASDGSSTTGGGTAYGSVVMGPGTRPGTTAGPSGLPSRPSSRPSPRAAVWLLGALLVVLATSAGLMWFNSDDGLDPSRVKPRRSVAVVGFENLSGREDADWLSTALAEMVTNELSQGGKLRTVTGTRVSEARRQAELGRLHELDAEQLARLRELLGCDFVISGSFVSLGGAGDGNGGDGGEGGGMGPVRLDVELQDAAVGSTLANVSEQGASDKLFDVVDRVGDELRDALGVGSDVDDPLSGLPRDPVAARLYAQALDALRTSRPEQARDLLQEALAKAPENALVHSALAAAWEALGFSGRASAEAARAFELSSGLSREDRLVVEARYRMLEGDLTAARSVYRSLWEYFPDNLDYGLGLVDAQVAAGVLDEAFDMLAQLRRLPEPLSEDPRIDLAEARAASRAGDLRRQREAAQRAAEAASASDAGLVLAQASLAQSQAERLLGEPEAAEVAARRASDLYRELNHAGGHALAATALANARLDQGDVKGARRGFEAAADLYREIGDRQGVSASHNNLAVVLKLLGDLEGAQQLYAENEEIFREVGDTVGLTNTQNNLAVLLVERDRLGEASDLLESSRATWERLGGPALAYSLNNRAEVLRLRGELDQAQRLHRQALDIRRQAGRKLDQLVSLANLAGLQLDLGEIEEAGTLLDEASELAEELGDPASRALVLYQQGRRAGLRAEYVAAAEAHEEALRLRRELALQGPVLTSRLALARMDLDTGLPARAELLAREILTQADASGRRAEAVYALATLVEALLDDQRLDEAAAAAERAASYEGVENFAARLALDLARTRVEAETTARAQVGIQEIDRRLQRFEDIAALAAQHGLRPESMRARRIGAAFALRYRVSRRDEILGRLRVLRAEAEASGLLAHAERAAALLPPR